MKKIMPDIGPILMQKKKLIYSVLLFFLSIVLVIALTLGWFQRIIINNVDSLNLYSSGITFELFKSVDADQDGIPDTDESNIIYVPESTDKIIFSNLYPNYTTAFKAEIDAGTRGGYLTLVFKGLAAPEFQYPTLPPTTPTPTPNSEASPTPTSEFTPTPTDAPTSTPTLPESSPTPTPSPTIAPSPTPIVDLTKALRIEYIDPNTELLVNKSLYEMLDENRNITIFSDYHITGDGLFTFKYKIYMASDAGLEYSGMSLLIDKTLFYMTQ